MRWILAFHIIFMVCWFAGIFYLPRLFVYHAQSNDAISNARFKVMERKLYYGIMTPSAILMIFFGLWLLSFNVNYYIHAHWMQLKLALVILLIFYHLYCGKLVSTFKNDNNTFSHIFYRWFNEVPVLFLIAIIILV